MERATLHGSRASKTKQTEIRNICTVNLHVPNIYVVCVCVCVCSDRLAIQLPDRILIYETTSGNAKDLHYQLKQKIIKKLDCNLLVVTSNNIILCQEKKLQLYTFEGTFRSRCKDVGITEIEIVSSRSFMHSLFFGFNRREGSRVGVGSCDPLYSRGRWSRGT